METDNTDRSNAQSSSAYRQYELDRLVYPPTIPIGNELNDSLIENQNFRASNNAASDSVQQNYAPYELLKNVLPVNLSFSSPTSYLPGRNANPDEHYPPIELDLTDDVPAAAADSSTSDNDKLRSGQFPMYDIRYWQSLFDTSSDEVYKRLRSALFPLLIAFRREEVEYYRQPDSYGPIWIIVTLLIVIFGSAAIIRADIGIDHAEDSILALLIVLFLLIVPSVCVLVTKFMFSHVSEHDYVSFHGVFSLFGYSLTAYIPAFLLIIVRVSRTFDMVVMIVAAIIGIILCMLQHATNAFDRSLDRGKQDFVIGVLIVSHIWLFFLMHHIVMTI